MSKQNVIVCVLLALLVGVMVLLALLPGGGAGAVRKDSAATGLARTSAGTAPSAVARPRVDPPVRPASLWRDYPTASPFEGVRWRANAPEVFVEGAWHELVSLDGIPAGRILASCRALDEGRWQKRFEQDLYAVLAQMGHAPGARVALEVRLPGAGEVRKIADVPMTEEQRNALWRARR